MPAEAGIHGNERRFQSWIPAFAGMTKEDGTAVALRHQPPHRGGDFGLAGDGRAVQGSGDGGRCAAAADLEDLMVEMVQEPPLDFRGDLRART